MDLKEKLQQHGQEVNERITEIEGQISELREELRSLKDLRRVLDPASVQSKKKKQWRFRMTKVERMEKLKIVNVMEDRIIELQELISEKENEGIKDDSYLQSLFALSEMLVKRN